MPNKEKNIPKRRFKAFENADAWELRKLGEYSTLITKGTTPRDKSGIGVVNFVKVENLVNGDIIPLQKIQLEEHEGYLKRSQLIENDILFSIAGTLGRTAIVKKSILPANTNQALSIIRGYEFDRNFLVTILRGVVVREFIKKNPTIGAQPNLSLEQVSNLCFLTPCSEEQSAIGTFFSTLDQQITLHQRKLDKLKSVKQAYLSEMFPAEGERVPKRRFPGFTDDWELRKLGEVAEINPKSQIPEKFEYVDLESVVGTSLISHRTVRAESAPSRAQRLALSGDIFYQTVRPYQKNNYLFDLSDDNYVFSTGYAQLRPKIDDRYLMIKIQDDGFVKEVLDRCTGTSYPAINSKDLSQISIDVPTSLPEQETIGTFFSTLDRQITLHQRKLEKLKNLKKALLNELFV
ncbi:TPA: restriction endonuclease subunit S [Streptococcus suis]|nr:restriction endonuclease subunit S [Streptococcus suis]